MRQRYDASDAKVEKYNKGAGKLFWNFLLNAQGCPNTEKKTTRLLEAEDDQKNQV